MQTLITEGIKVSVETHYQNNYSRPMEGKYIHAYRVTIENLSDSTVQLLRRHWRVRDSNGEFRQIEGEGVIGIQPVLEPGEAHQYVSWCHLRTGLGKMWGTYLMQETMQEERFSVQIPEFNLVAPFKLN